MFSIFLPQFSGTYQPETISTQLMTNLSKRLTTGGVFPLASSRRNRYEVLEHTDTALRFRSTSLLTGITIGLNDVSLRLDQSQPVQPAIHYHVRFWTWAKYAIFLCLGIIAPCGIFILPPLFGIDLVPPHYIAPVSQIKMVGIPMLVFWGLVWPWLLIALHKKHAARCLENILAEVNTGDK